MHPNNRHRDGYNFSELEKNHPEIKEFIFTNNYGNTSVNFSNPKAVFNLNKALLLTHYNLSNWQLPEGFLCPPIPGRADYVHHIADLIANNTFENEHVKGLDIGVGASAIYPILGAQIYNWNMVGADISEASVDFAKRNVEATAGLSNSIAIRHQTNNSNIFNDIILPDEHFTFTMCNPPFFMSEEDAQKEQLRKLKNLHDSKDLQLNFGGQANELWCNGGEALFIKRMVKESVHFKLQVTWFTTLVSRSEHLPKLEKQLRKLKATIRIIPMAQGHKKSRILAWRFI